MSSGERVLDLSALLKRRKGGVARKDFDGRWACSPVTVHRVAKSTRDELGLPIRFDSSRGAYCLDPDKAEELRSAFAEMVRRAVDR